MKRVDFWRYSKEQDLDIKNLIKEEYEGIRPAPGYPACPEHSEKESLFKILEVTRHTGITLTENYAMSPAASVSGWCFSHPDSKYFGVGKLNKDQVEDYAARKALQISQAEQLLQPNLNI